MFMYLLNFIVMFQPYYCFFFYFSFPPRLAIGYFAGKGSEGSIMACIQSVFNKLELELEPWILKIPCYRWANFTGNHTDRSQFWGPVHSKIEEIRHSNRRLIKGFIILYSVRSLVKYFSTLEEKFRISKWPCNVLFII